MQGAKQVQLLRAQLIRQLRQDLGPNLSAGQTNWCANMSPTRTSSPPPSIASSTISTRWHRPKRRSKTGATARLRSASREALAALWTSSTRWPTTSTDQLSTLADDLASVAKLLARESVLTRYLTDPPTTRAQGRPAGAAAGGQGRRHALEVLKAAVSGRWSADANLVDAVEHVARQALLVRAEREELATTSKTSCSGSPASSMPSRGLPSCWATTACPPRAESSCCAMSSTAGPE